MGTSLTGTKPKDTYDSLIKVGDNGPISGTAKYLSDGLGNDLPIAVSTSAVGIGTSSPTRPLTIQGPDNGEGQLRLQGTGSTTSYSEIGRESLSTGQFRIKLSRNGTVITPLVIDDTTGNVGIGISNPTVKLDVLNTLRLQASGQGIFYLSNGVVQHQIAVEADPNNKLAFKWNGTERMALTDNGLTFNGDTAAANALDDYEEGTWTPSFVMGTSGTVTMGDFLGRYTKVGNLVTCTGYANAASVSSPVGELRIAGLPFTTATGGDSSINIYAYGFGNTTAVTAYQGFTVGTLNYAIVRGFVNGDQVQNIGANVVGSAGLIFTITYRV